MKKELLQLKQNELRRYPGYKTKSAWVRMGGALKIDAKPEAVTFQPNSKLPLHLYTADALKIVPPNCPTEKIESDKDREARIKESVEKCRDILADPDGYLILDIEATQNKVLELVLLSLDGTVAYESLFKPGATIDAASMQIHGISKDDVKDAPRFWDEWEKIQALMDGKCLLIFSASNDIKFIRTTIGDKQWETPYLCVQQLYYNYRDFSNQQSLSNACLQSGVSVKDSHRAQVDCSMTLDLIKAIAKKAPLNENYEAVVREKASPRGGAFKMGDMVDDGLLALRDQLLQQSK